MRIRAALTVLIGALFTFWIWQAGAIEEALSCPDTCLSHRVGYVKDTGSGEVHYGQDGASNGGRWHSARIELAGGGRSIKVSQNLHQGDRVDVGFWHGKAVSVDGLPIHGSVWPETWWHTLLTLPLYAILVYCALTVIYELVVRWRGKPVHEKSMAGCFPAFAAVLSVPISLFAVGFTNNDDMPWFPRWWPWPLLALLGLLAVAGAARNHQLIRRAGQQSG